MKDEKREENDFRDIGERLRQFMESQDLSVNTMAKNLSTHPAQIRSMLQGNNYGVKYFLRFLRQYPQLNVNWLMCEQGEMLTPVQYTKEMLLLLRYRTRIPGLADRLAEYLQKKNMSAYAFAKGLGISPSVMYNIIKGDKNYGMEYVFSIIIQCRDVNPMWLLKGEQNKKEKDPDKEKKRTIKEHSLDHKKELDTIVAVLSTFKDIHQEEVAALREGQQALEQGQKNLKADLQEIKELLKAQSKK